MHDGVVGGKDVVVARRETDAAEVVAKVDARKGAICERRRARVSDTVVLMLWPGAHVGVEVGALRRKVGWGWVLRHHGTRIVRRRRADVVAVSSIVAAACHWRYSGVVECLIGRLELKRLELI